MTPHKIEVKDLQDWLSSQEILFARSSRENKSLHCSTNGTITVRHGDKIVWQGIQAFSAVEAYNDIVNDFIK